MKMTEETVWPQEQGFLEYFQIEWDGGGVSYDIITRFWYGPFWTKIAEEEPWDTI